MFCHYNKKMVNTDTIASVTCDDFAEWNVVHVHYKNGEMELVTGAEAIGLMMLLCPAVLEGQRAKHARHSWAIHNLIGHPLMQIFTWLHLTKLAIWIHDVTVPEALVRDEC
jgi:hypothetical protein